MRQVTRISGGSVIKINGKETPKSEALDLLKRDEVVVNTLSVELSNENEDRGEIANDGVEISKEYTRAISESMDRSNASYARVTLSSCRKLKNRDVILIIRDPDHATRWQKWMLSLIERLI